MIQRTLGIAVGLMGLLCLVATFRDYLRTHQGVALEYAELTRHLADRYRFDREAYTDAKEPFVRRIVEVALQPGASDRST